MNPQFNKSLNTAINNLVNIVKQLRDRDSGCPWDIEQTHKSLIPFVIEEAYEVADAIREENTKEIKEELGDLLLQVVLHAQIASEEKKFNFSDVIEEINQKLIRRHPHVFKKRELISIEEVNNNWEKIKAKEKKSSNSLSPISDQLKVKIRSQSATNAAFSISNKVATVGLEWTEENDIWNKIDEEFAELKTALKSNLLEEAEAELGDILFTLINLARWYKLNPEEGLMSTNKKILNRLSFIEKTVNYDISNITHKRMREYWQQAKNADHKEPK